MVQNVSLEATVYYNWFTYGWWTKSRNRLACSCGVIAEKISGLSAMACLQSRKICLQKNRFFASCALKGDWSSSFPTWWTPESFYTKHTFYILLHRSNFYTKHLLHQTNPNNFYTRNLLHQKTNFCTTRLCITWSLVHWCWYTFFSHFPPTPAACGIWATWLELSWVC